MTDIQNPGAVKPEALNPVRDALAELVAVKDLRLDFAQRCNGSPVPPQWVLNVSREIARREPLAWIAARAALELQPEPALTEEQAHALLDLLYQWKGCIDMTTDDFAKRVRPILALGRGVPSSLLEKSEGSFYPVSTLLWEKHEAAAYGGWTDAVIVAAENFSEVHHGGDPDLKFFALHTFIQGAHWQKRMSAEIAPESRIAQAGRKAMQAMPEPLTDERIADLIAAHFRGIPLPRGEFVRVRDFARAIEAETHPPAPEPDSTEASTKPVAGAPEPRLINAEPVAWLYVLKGNGKRYLALAGDELDPHIREALGAFPVYRRPVPTSLEEKT